MEEGDLHGAMIDAAFRRMISLNYSPQEQFLLRVEVRRALRQAARRRVRLHALLWVTMLLFPSEWEISHLN